MVSIHWRIRAIHVTTEGLAGYDVTSTFTWGIDPLADLGDSLPVPVLHMPSLGAQNEVFWNCRINELMYII